MGGVMLFNRLSVRKYLGVVVITLSIILFLTQVGPILPSNSIPFPRNRGTATIISMGALVGGVYLLAGPVGVLITLIPLTSLGFTGCGGQKQEEDLGEPPNPPT